MAPRVFETVLAIAIATMLMWGQTSAQTTCTPAIVGLTPCIGFITGSPSPPSPACCTQLASVVQSQARCLCTFINGGAAQLGINVNQTQALTLPGACQIQAPPLSQCNAATGAGAPAGSPEGAPAPASPSATSSPSDTSPSTPSSPSAPSGSTTTTTVTPSVPSRSKTVPTVGQSSAAGGSTKFTHSVVFFFLLFAACA